MNKENEEEFGELMLKGHTEYDAMAIIISRLENCLNSRDNFIGSNGLFTKYLEFING